MPTARNHFEVLGFPPTYFIDRAELEARYREGQRHSHPDRFSRAPASERAQVLQRATDLNDAYRVLKSDVRRAEYLLSLRGIDLSEEAEQAGGKKRALDPLFLSDVLELREELQEARLHNDGARIASMGADIRARMAQETQRVAAGFSRLSAAAKDDAAALDALADALLKLRYYQRFLDDMTAHEEATA
ncbi:MAG: Fe-S protein assembly co-chaperone HscB [Myxococcales bacterium]|nr:Fe-S protein assembly co-chaperone HscB [Myxococcales bacterium]